MPFLRFRKCIRWSRRLFSAPLKMRRVPEKAVSGTEYACRAQKGFLGYATHFQCAKRLRSEVIRHKRRVTSSLSRLFRYCLKKQTFLKNIFILLFMFVNTKGKSPSLTARFKNYLVWLDLVQPLFFTMLLFSIRVVSFVVIPQRINEQ